MGWNVNTKAATTSVGTEEIGFFSFVCAGFDIGCSVLALPVQKTWEPNALVEEFLEVIEKHRYLFKPK